MPHTQAEIELLLRLWPVFLGVVMLVAWLIRLEANHLSLKDRFDEHKNNSKKEFDDHKKNVKDNEEKMVEKIDTIKEQNTKILISITRLEGKKGVSNETVV